MYVTQADLFRILSFEYGVTQADMQRHCGVGKSLWFKNVLADEMIPKIDKGLADLFGKDYRSERNINKYLRHEEIIKDVDISLIRKRRQFFNLTTAEIGDMIELSKGSYQKIEHGKNDVKSWKMYIDLTMILKSDLLKADSKFKVKRNNKRSTPKKYITFKNVGGRWVLGRKMVY